MGALLWRRGITAVAAVCWLLFQPVHAFQPTDEPTLLLDQAQSTLVAKPIEGLRLAREAAALEESGVAPRDAIMMRAAWLEAESLFRLSLPGDAAEVLKETLSTYRNAGGTALYGKLLITSARVARSFGDNGLALKNFQDAYKLFSELGVTRYQAMALQGISTLYTNARRYERAIEYDRRAAEIHPNDSIMKIASLNNRGYALRKLGRFDEARSMFEEALNLDIIPEVPSLGVRLYANIAAMELAAGDIDRVRAALRGQEKLAANLSKDQAPLLLAAVQAEIAYRDGERTEAEAILDEAFLGVDLEETPEDAIEAHALAA
ncbi:MAG: tetratricopeptide repeat protein, partial [Pseudomonadota bacterium]